MSFSKYLKQNGYIVLICYIVQVSFVNATNYMLIKPDLPPMPPSFSLEGIKGLLGSFPH